MYFHKAFLLATIVALPCAAQTTVPNLCSGSERILWSGTDHGRIYSVCAGKSTTTPYVQYRAGHAGHLDLVYPSDKVPARGHFTFSEGARDASLSFDNGGYTYTIVEPLVGPTLVRVEHAGKQVAILTMDTASETLTTNDAIAFFKAAGVAD